MCGAVSVYYSDAEGDVPYGRDPHYLQTHSSTNPATTTKMMKLAHNIKLTTFSYESDGDDTEKIAIALASLCPFSLETEKLNIKHTSAQGFKERKIVILELTLTKERHTAKFLAHLKDSLSKDQISLIRKQLESRLDGELNFFIRLDKPKFMKNKIYSITERGNCFHIKMSMAAYPKNREKALNVVQDWLSE